MVLFLFITFINNMGAFLFNKEYRGCRPFSAENCPLDSFPVRYEPTDAFAPYPLGLKKVAREGRNHYNDTS